jgi:hypothetical protein
MDPLRFAIAAVPLAAYLILLGVVNLRRRPTLATGGSDLGAMGAAVGGLAFVGPIALFRPDAATVELGNFVWLFLTAFYLLWVTLAAMLCRPRLVVYNLSAEELRPVLSEAVQNLDSAGRWAGDNLTLPTIGVHGYVDGFAWMRNTSFIAGGGKQDLAGWRRLNRVVERALRGVTTRPNQRGWLLLGAGIALLAAATVGLASDPRSVATAWTQVFAF